jgi:hypothetical protein
VTGSGCDVTRDVAHAAGGSFIVRLGSQLVRGCRRHESGGSELAGLSESPLSSRDVGLRGRFSRGKIVEALG